MKAARAILVKMEQDAGDQGMALARALIRGYAGIGRGVDGKGCISYLADKVLDGSVVIEKGSWVYLDAEGTRRIGGGFGDKVLPGIAQIAVLLHKNTGAEELYESEILERLSKSADKVSMELEWRRARIYEQEPSGISIA